MDYRAALTEFYKQYNPDKLKEVDLLLAKYRGREEELLHALKVKYGAHKTAPQPPSPPPPPPREAQPEEKKPQPEEPPPPPPAQEPASAGQSGQDAITKERSDTGTANPTGAVVDKGRTAAERAEYWKKELEKRERERGLADKAREGKAVASKSDKQPPQKETEEEVESGENSSSGFRFRTIALIILLLVILGGIIYALLNSNIRNYLAAKAGLVKTTEEQSKLEKKEGIDPGLLAQGKDANADPNKSGDFALDEEEQEGDSREKEEAMGEQTGTAQAGSQTNLDERSNSSGSDKVSGGLQRNFWYLSYASLSSESSAQKIVRELQAQGIDNSGYYYIPDYDSRGKKLYKVYIGPYSTVEGAERALTDNMRKISSGAYPYLLK